MRRKTGQYFETAPGAPLPVRVSVRHRVRFSEVDAMAIAWHGRYLQYFEIAAEELALRIGLSYGAYRDANLHAPVVQAHVDYHHPLWLGEFIDIEARLVWNDAARLNTEYVVTDPRGQRAASGFTVQMFTDGTTGTPCLVPPPLVTACRQRWRHGEFDHP